MPTVSKGSRVLVTGASSYIGQHCVQQLLARGYTVRGTVRTPAQGDELLSTFPKGFDYAVVPDIATDNCFQGLTHDVEGILHVASPFHFNFTNARTELVEPAKDGVLNVLKAGTDSATLKRIVLTSSTAAVFIQGTPPEVFDASKDWNTVSPANYFADPDKPTEDKMDRYRASKAIAERAAWDWYKSNKANIGWDLVSIAPGYVFGPLVEPKTQKLNVSLGLVDAFIRGKKADADLQLRQVGNAVDVRDVARAHVLAMEKQDAGDRRMGVGCGPFTWQQVVDAIHAKFPDEAKRAGVPVGTPGSYKQQKHWTVLDTSQAEQVLGYKHIDVATSAQDTAESLWQRQKAGL